MDAKNASALPTQLRLNLSNGEAATKPMMAYCLGVLDVSRTTWRCVSAVHITFNRPHAQHDASVKLE